MFNFAFVSTDMEGMTDSSDTTAEDQSQVESFIRWVETSTAQVRAHDGDLRGYVIDVEDWRQMRVALRRIAHPPEVIDVSHAGVPCE